MPITESVEMKGTASGNEVCSTLISPPIKENQILLVEAVLCD